MKKRVLSLLLALAMCLSLSVPAWAAGFNTTNDVTMGELQNELLAYLSKNKVDLDIGTKEFYDFILNQLIYSTDETLASLPNYPYIHAYMAKYKNMYDESVHTRSLNSITTESEVLAPFYENPQFLSTSIEDVKKEVSERNLTAKKQSHSVIPREESTYSGAAAVAYARQYATGYNREYPYYSSGDCANFVSQCIHAGGMAFSGASTSMTTVDTTTQWYCTYYPHLGWGVTTSWIRVADFHTFWSRHAVSRYVTTQAQLKTYSQVGCAVQLVSASTGENYHTIIISEKTSSTFKYCGHTEARLDASISIISDTSNNYYIYSF